jgi:hypothetical protein
MTIYASMSCSEVPTKTALVQYFADSTCSRGADSFTIFPQGICASGIVTANLVYSLLLVNVLIYQCICNFFIVVSGNQMLSSVRCDSNPGQTTRCKYSVEQTAQERRQRRSRQSRAQATVSIARAVLSRAKTGYAKISCSYIPPMQAVATFYSDNKCNNIVLSQTRMVSDKCTLIPSLQPPTSIKASCSQAGKCQHFEIYTNGGCSGSAVVVTPASVGDEIACRPFNFMSMGTFYVAVGCGLCTPRTTLLRRLRRTPAAPTQTAAPTSAAPTKTAAPTAAPTAALGACRCVYA